MKITEFKTREGICAVHIEELSEPFSIFKSFDCGQCFRFDPVSLFGNKIEVGGVAFSKYVVFAQNHEGEIIIYNSTLDDYEKIWRSYLCLDDSYTERNRAILNACGDGHMEKAVAYGEGIKILRQDAWECLISFIISQNNNIPRIKKIICAICEKYGEKISFLNGEYYTFPTVDRLMCVTEDDFFALKTGFRAKYLASAVKCVTEGIVSLDNVRALPFDEAVAHLSLIKGVGLKVASCILLFGFGKTEAFPIDVHIRRTLDTYFPSGIDLISLGKNAGIAQQYLFYYEKYKQSP